jgi:hypothetical protein
MSGYMRELENDGERLAIDGSYIRQPPKETEFTSDNPAAAPGILCERSRSALNRVEPNAGVRIGFLTQVLRNAEIKSVFEKSLPLKSNGKPVAFANA